MRQMYTQLLYIQSKCVYTKNAPAGAFLWQERCGYEDKAFRTSPEMTLPPACPACIARLK